MSDLLKRLRDEVGPEPVNYRAEMMKKAADEIDRLNTLVNQIKTFANGMRASAGLVGPREYQDRRELKKVWNVARYHDGKDILEMIRANAAKQ